MLRREAVKKQVRLERAYDQKLREDEMKLKLGRAQNNKPYRPVGASDFAKGATGATLCEMPEQSVLTLDPEPVYYRPGDRVKDKATGKLGKVSRVCRRVVEVQFANEHEWMSGTTAYRRATIHEHLERVYP